MYVAIFCEKIGKKKKVQSVEEEENDGLEEEMEVEEGGEGEKGEGGTRSEAVLVSEEEGTDTHKVSQQTSKGKNWSSYMSFYYDLIALYHTQC